MDIVGRISPDESRVENGTISLSASVNRWRSHCFGYPDITEMVLF